MRYWLPVAIVAVAALALASPAAAQDAAKKKAPAAGAKKAKKDHHDPTIKKQDFGTTTIGGVKFEKITQEGAIEAGHEGAFDVVIAEGQKPPKALRAWIGTESAEGSTKTKLEKEPNRHYHSHVETPDPIPAGAQYWLEVEPEGGKKAKAGFKFFTEE